MGFIFLMACRGAILFCCCCKLYRTEFLTLIFKWSKPLCATYIPHKLKAISTLIFIKDYTFKIIVCRKWKFISKLRTKLKTGFETKISFAGGDSKSHVAMRFTSLISWLASKIKSNVYPKKNQPYLPCKRLESKSQMRPRQHRHTTLSPLPSSMA